MVVKPFDPTIDIDQEILDHILKLCYIENMIYWDCIASCLYEAEKECVTLREIIARREDMNKVSHERYTYEHLNPNRYEYAMSWYEEKGE